LKNEENLKGKKKKHLIEINNAIQDVKNKIQPLRYMKEYKDSYINFLESSYPVQISPSGQKSGFMQDYDTILEEYDSTPDDAPLPVRFSTILPAVSEFKKLMNDLGELLYPGAGNRNSTIEFQLNHFENTLQMLIEEKRQLIGKVKSRV